MNLPGGNTGLRQRREHQFGDGPVRFEIPVNSIWIGAARKHFVGHGGLQVDQGIWCCPAHAVIASTVPWRP